MSRSQKVSSGFDQGSYLQNYQSSSIRKPEEHYQFEPYSSNSHNHSQKLSLHSNPDLEIVINNKTFEDQRLELKVDTFDRESGRSSREKYEKIIPALSQYCYQSNSRRYLEDNFTKEEDSRKYYSSNRDNMGRDFGVNSELRKGTDSSLEIYSPKSGIRHF